MITGAHVIIDSTDAEADRRFLRDVLGLQGVDAGDGWLIFALPPSELAVHPAAEARQELYLMCGDLEATMAGLETKGATFEMPVREASWGRVVTMVVPGGTRLALYEPRHPRP